MKIHWGDWIRRESRGRRETRRVRVRFAPVSMALDQVLEPRILLSAIVVSNARDSGPGSLRAAVARATNGDSIVFSNRLDGQTITLHSEIDITTNLNISGPVGDPVVLSGGGTTRVLEIDGATVRLSDLVVTQGSAAIGGGVFDLNGNLSVSNVLFTHNVAQGSPTQIAQGGAIEEQSGSLSISGSRFTGNRVIGDPESPVVYPAPSPPPPPPPPGVIIAPIVTNPPPTDYGGEADGGAVADQGGTLVVRNSKFSANQAIGSPIPSEQYGGDAYGGAIFVANATLTSSASTFEGNQAIGGQLVNSSPASQGFDFVAGGAATGGAISSNSSSVTLQNNTIDLNAARGGQAQSIAGATTGAQAGLALGGGVALSNDSTVSLIGGTICSNEALGGSGVASGSASGGGVASEEDSSVSIDGTTFSDNVAGSGDAPNSSNLTSFALAGSASGGAIYFSGVGSLVMAQATIQGNSAIGGTAQSPGAASGGGVEVDDGGTVTITDSILQGNLAETGQGFVPTPLNVGPNTSLLSPAKASGGGIDVSAASGIFSLVHSQVTANRAVGVENGVAYGGALSFYDVQVNLATDTLRSNAAIGGSIVTGPIFGEEPYGQSSGGAVAVLDEEYATPIPLTVTNSSFVGNEAMTPAVNQEYAQAGSNDGSLGGAIFNNGASLVIYGGSFVNNQAIGAAGLAGSQGANGQGGAIYSSGTVPFIPFNTKSPPVPGPPNSSVSATGVTFRNNLAMGGLGAAQSSPMAGVDGAGQGGAIDNDEYSSLVLSSSTIVANQAIGAGQGQGQGGGLYLAPISMNTVGNDTIVNNRATTSGNDVDNLSQ
jgi:hypothetical protein